MKRSLFVGLMAMAYAVPALAAVTNNGIYEGATLEWDGVPANVNTIQVHNGMGRVAGTDTYIAGQAMTTVPPGGNFDWDTNTIPTLAQTAEKAYYVYYTAYTHSSMTDYDYVISLTPPLSEGYPSSPLAFTSQHGDSITGDLSALYLGSYLSDHGSNIIPFQRFGGDVWLYNPGSGLGPWSNAFVNDVPFFPTSCASTYPCSQLVVFADANANFLTWPTSATGLIVNVTAATTGAGTAYLGIFESALVPVGGAVSWTPSLVATATSTLGQTFNFAKVPIANGTEINVADAIKPAVGTNDHLMITVVGYTEVVNKLF